jgi:uncharacterized protein with ParB-like and HNH nuclease domain
MSFFPPVSVADVIQKIEYNQYLLPAIQRDFVWPHQKIEMLFDSLMQGYPIGSMLLWRVEGRLAQSQRFYGILRKYRERYLIRTEQVNTNGMPGFDVVLDGQQRLTALYLGLRGSYAYHGYNLAWKDNEYSIPTRHLYLSLGYKKSEKYDMNDSDDDNKYDFRFLKTDEAVPDENGIGWFKVADILDIKGTSKLNAFYRSNDLSDNEEAQDIINRLHDMVHLDKPVQYYQEQNVDFTRALNIFIRINSGGISLSYSDLVMSTTISGWQILDARKEINGLVDELVEEYGFPVNKDFILRTYLILYNDDIKFRVENFTVKNAKEFEKHWTEIRAAIVEVFQLVWDFGYAPKTLTSLNALLPIVYYLYKTNKVAQFCQKTGYKEDRALIKKWLHVVLLHQIFGGQAEGVLKLIRDTIKKQITKDSFLFPAKPIADRLSKTSKSISVDEEFVTNLLYTHKNDRYAFAILALLFPHLDYKNRDFHLDHCHPYSSFTDKKLKAAVIKIDEENKEYYTDDDYYDTIINLQMLDGNENKSKNSQALKVWVDEYQPSLKKHYLPKELELNQFPTFVDKRFKLLHTALTDVLIF